MDFQELTENKPGLIGLIVAVVGLILVFVWPYLGVVALLGLFIASRGMKEEPKALAIGGMGVGGLGIVLMLAFNFMGSGGSSGSTSSSSNSAQMTEVDQVTAKLEDIKVSVGSFYAENNRLPKQLTEFGGPPQMYNDVWGNPITVKQSGQRTFQLTSNGPDGQLGTGDDIVVEGGF